MKPYRILLITEATFAGVARHVIGLACGLRQLGHEVHLLYSPVRKDHLFEHGLERLQALGGRLATAPMRRSPHPHDALAAARVRRYLKSHGPFDFIHGHSSKGGALARLAAVGLPGARLYTPHAMFTMNAGLGAAARGMFATVERMLSRLGHGIILVSHDEYEHVRGLGVDLRRLFLVENGIDLESVPATSPLRADLGIAADEVCIGFVGRFAGQKDPENLLRAFGRLAPKYPRARLIMVGSGPLGDSLRAEAVQLGIQDRVSWPGVLDGPSVMPAFDIFAMPSRYEAFPYVLLESMAAGLPIVATRVGGTQSLVAEGGNGFVVPPQDPASLAEALDRLLANDESRTQMGCESARRIKQYTIQNMVSKTLAVYETVAASSSRSARSTDNSQSVMRTVGESARLSAPPEWGGLRIAARGMLHHTAATLSVTAHAMLGDRSGAAPGILLYHRVVAPPPGVSCPTSNVAPQRFRTQLEGLLARGYDPWSLRRLLEHHRDGQPVPTRVFVVTFDDGFESVYTTAWPILRDLHIPATVLLSTCYVGSQAAAAHDDWEAAGSPHVPASAWRALSPEQCKEMHAGGLVDFGSHGHGHQDFRGRPGEFRRDLRASLDCLGTMFGPQAFPFPFSFPWGFSTPEMVEIARQEGLSCALTLDRRPVTPGLDPFGWGRFQAEGTDTAAALAAKLAGWYTPFRDIYQHLKPRPRVVPS